MIAFGYYVVTEKLPAKLPFRACVKLVRYIRLVLSATVFYKL